MSSKGPSLTTIKTFPEQLEQLLQICILQTEFHEQSSSGILAFKESLGLTHFNLLPDRYPTVENIDEFSRCMHRYQLSLSSLVTLHFSFSNVLPQILKGCNPEKLNVLIESESFHSICNTVFNIFILKKIKNHLIPYKINLEKELKHGNPQKLTEAALLEIQKSKEQIPLITLQCICEGLKILDGSVVDHAVEHLKIPKIPSPKTSSKEIPILKILKKEIKSLEKAIELISFDIEIDQKVLFFIAGFLDSLFSLLHIVSEFKEFQQQLKILKELLQEVNISQDSMAPVLADKLIVQIEKLNVGSEGLPHDSWDSFDITNKKLVTFTYDEEPDWGEVITPSAITPSYNIAQAASSGDSATEIAKLGEDQSSSTLTINKIMS